MRIGVVGAGPAGLYFAILAKRADPSHEITVVERNPADATYGWGVVFSSETLTELEDADYETFLRLDDALVRWSAIDIRYAGRTLRAHGHGFSAIVRTALLGALQDRAAELGVQLRFSTEVTGLAMFDDCDLVVGADGVRSTVREELADHVGPSAAPHDSRYVWFGTDLAFEVFTFVFSPTEHGLFQVHAYPYSAGGSTFIVECHVDTWHRAGLEDASEEETLAFCTALFGEHLEGRRLLSNASTWRTFETLRTRSWHHGNTVLLGDAAHTAHFSIGSGTKLAIEDAIALSKALVAHGDDLGAAFAEYELERQGPVERFQEAAVDSARYFESVSRYLHFSPEQFAFNLLTRSGRITRADLELRDPATVNLIDRWVHAAAVHDDAGSGTEAGIEDAELGRMIVPPPALAPLAVGPTQLPNRVVLAVTPRDTSYDGSIDDGAAEDLAVAVALGAGLVVTEPVAVSLHGRVTVGSPTICDDAAATAWAKALDVARAAGDAAIALRLGHAGRRGATRPRSEGLDRPLRAGAWPLIAPSPLPYTPRSAVPSDLAEKMAEVTEDFVGAARRGAQAGFDALLLDASDGYLLASCLSPLSNHRTDAYGGTLENRLRYLIEVLDAVREVWPTERGLGVRLSCDDRIAGGLTPDEAVRIARTLTEHGCDLVDVTAGHTVPTEVAAPDYRRLFNVGLADRIRNEGRVPVIVGGAITTFDEVSTIVAAGRADACVLDLSRYGKET